VSQFNQTSRPSTNPPAPPTNNQLIDRFIEQLSTYTPPTPSAGDNVAFSNTYNNIKNEFDHTKMAETLGGRNTNSTSAGYSTSAGTTLNMTARQNLGRSSSRASSSKQGDQNGGFGDLYHVLSIAFLLMEEERETFQKQLSSVEDFFVKRAKYGGLLSLQSVARRLVYRRTSLAFSCWLQYVR